MQRGRFQERAGEGKTDYGYAETDPSGRYGRFEEVLGKGAMKTVYKAIDEVLGMEVAWNQVKLNDLLHSPDDLQRLYSEVHILSTLNHDSIIRFYNSWIDTDRRTFNFITEMFSSGTLRGYRKKYKQIRIRAVKNWALQVLNGLVYLHSHDPPVIHRDLKCDNIFVNGHLGQVKIGDLGLAAILRGSHIAHSVIGTPEFMAPELYEENYNELVDVYSFGMCILEMLTLEYPYSECANPAQIYKKVISGKLPRAFYKVEDLEAQQFVGKCLETASKRLSAKDLLLDPFLAFDEDDLMPLTNAGCQKPFLNANTRIAELWLTETENPPETNMTITGKLNPEDDTIFLKVQIADEEGSVRNVFFPFDVSNDTPLDVAREMVKELEITDWQSSEIADMIDGEISALMPDWKQQDRPHPFSSSSSSQVSFLGLINSHKTDERSHGCDWLQEDWFDDSSSQSSLHSGKYSYNCFSGEEHDYPMSPRRRDYQYPTVNGYVSTRLCPEETSRMRQPLGRNCLKPCKVLLNSEVASTSKDKWATDGCQLTSNRSLVDLRSQLLHRSLVEELNKRRMFKTVDAVENIGFKTPVGLSEKERRAVDAARSLRTRSYGKR